MDKPNRRFNDHEINQLNEKVIQSQLFTPDRVYIELGLLKDIPIGIMYADQVIVKNDPVGFDIVQSKVQECLSDYQKREYETIEPFFKTVCYDDNIINKLLEQREYHDIYFLMAPMTRFLNTLIRHTIRNQNNSRPANKYVKTPIENRQYVLAPIPVTYTFNTFPLFLSQKCMERAAEELGESFGVDVEFMCKDPSTFDDKDWDTWLGTIDCFYFDSLGRFLRCSIINKKHEEMKTVGKYLFARKRFEKSTMNLFPNKDEFYHDIQRATALLDIYYEFNWLENNQIRLTEEPEDSHEDAFFTQAEPATV